LKRFIQLVQSVT